MTVTDKGKRRRQEERGTRNGKSSEAKERMKKGQGARIRKDASICRVSQERKNRTTTTTTTTTTTNTTSTSTTTIVSCRICVTLE